MPTAPPKNTARGCLSRRTPRRLMLHNNVSGLENFRTGIRPEINREDFKTGSPAGRRPAGGPILRLSRQESCRHPAGKPDFRPGTRLLKTQCFRPGPGFGERFWAGVGRKPKANGQKTSQNCSSLRPRKSYTGLWIWRIHIKLTKKIGPQPAPNAGRNSTGFGDLDTHRNPMNL